MPLLVTADFETGIGELPTMLLTYDFHDLAEASAVRALAGENAVRGRLPVALTDRFPAGHGLDRVPGTRSQGS